AGGEKIQASDCCLRWPRWDSNRHSRLGNPSPSLYFSFLEESQKYPESQKRAEKRKRRAFPAHEKGSEFKNDLDACDARKRPQKDRLVLSKQGAETSPREILGRAARSDITPFI